MRQKNTTVLKIAQTALLAALCYVSFTFLQIKIPMPGGDATSLHIGNAFCVRGALLVGGVYGGLAGAIGMSIADIMDPVYITMKIVSQPCFCRTYHRDEPQDLFLNSSLALQNPSWRCVISADG